METQSIHTHSYWMGKALEQACKAAAIGEVPIGAVVVYRNEIIGQGYNLRETTFNSTAHAELIAIQAATQFLQAWRLLECILYVTLEPCPMCAGAIVQARIPTIVYGTSDPKAGCAGTLMNLLQEPRFNHQAHVIGGILRHECTSVLTHFFRQLRNK